MNFLQKMYGNFESRDEVKKFVVLGLAFFLIIGTYWSLRPLKDALFASIVGIKWQPWAKIISMFAVFPIVMGYSKLVDKFKKNTVFYILVSFYSLTAFLFAYLFMNPEIGLANTVESPSRLLGWFWYIWVESFGSLIVALFWAYAQDITAPESAKRGFPLIAMLGQLGNIVGPLTLDNLPKSVPLGYLVVITGIMTALIGVVIGLFTRVVPAAQRRIYTAGNDKPHIDPGFFEGLKLLLKTPYLLSIFGIITIYETIVTTFDFLFKTNVTETYLDAAARASVLFQYAYWVGIVAFLCVLLGINNIQRRLGMKISLLVLPVLVGVAVLSTKFVGGISLFFWIMVISKAVNYALNQPTLKQLYIPTSEDAKFKSQAWIEMFGSRFSKAASSSFNNVRKSLVAVSGPAGSATFMTIFTLGSFGLLALWVPVAIYAANTYNRAIKNNEEIC